MYISPGKTPGKSQLLYFCPRSHLWDARTLLEQSISPLSLAITSSNRYFPFAYTMLLILPSVIQSSLDTIFLASKTPFFFFLLPFITELLEWVISISFLPLSLEHSPIRLLAHHSRENCFSQGCKWPSLSKSHAQFSDLISLTYLQNLTLWKSFFNTFLIFLTH